MRRVTCSQCSCPWHMQDVHAAAGGAHVSTPDSGACVLWHRGFGLATKNSDDGTLLWLLNAVFDFMQEGC